MFQAKTYASAFTAWALLQLAFAAPLPLHLDALQQHVTAGYGCVTKADTSSEVTAYHINVGVMPDEGCENIITHVQNVSNVVDWVCRIDPGSMTWVGVSTHPSPADDTLMEAINMALPGIRWLETDECVSLTSPDEGFLQHHDGRIQYGLRANQRFETISRASILRKRRLPDLAARGNPTANGPNEVKRLNDESGPQSGEPPLVDTDNFVKQLQLLGSTALDKVLHFIWPFARDENNSRTRHTVDTLNIEPPNNHEHSSHGLSRKRNQVLPGGLETRDQVGHEERPVPTNSHSALQPGKAHAMAGMHVHEPHIHGHHHRYDRLRSKRMPPPNDKIKSADESSSSQHKRQYATACNIVDLGDKAEVEILVDEPFVVGQNTAASRRFRGKTLVHNFKFERGDKDGKRTRIAFTTPRRSLAEADARLSKALPNCIFECAKHNRTNKSKTAKKEGDNAAVEARDVAIGMKTNLSESTPDSCLRTEKELGMNLDQRGNCMSSPHPGLPLQFATTCRIEDYNGRAAVDILVNGPYQSGHCDEAKLRMKKKIPSVQHAYCAPELKDTTKTRIQFFANYKDLGKTDAELHLAFGQKSIFKCSEQAARTVSAQPRPPQAVPEIQIEGSPWMGTDIHGSRRIKM